MPVSDAERLRAAGHVVTLASGTYPLIYDFGALLLLEQDFGGLMGISAVLQAWGTPPKTNGKKPVDAVKMSELRSFLVAGLSHVPLTADEVVRGFLLSNVKEYLSVVDKAMDEAFLPFVDGQGNGRSEEATTASNGETSTSSPQSDMAALVTTSGE